MRTTKRKMLPDAAKQWRESFRGMKGRFRCKSPNIYIPISCWMWVTSLINQWEKGHLWLSIVSLPTEDWVSVFLHRFTMM
jgi:hypothetical protein